MLRNGALSYQGIVPLLILSLPDALTEEKGSSLYEVKPVVVIVEILVY